MNEDNTPKEEITARYSGRTVEDMLKDGSFYDPTKKLYDPFGEYSAHDNEEKKEPDKPRTWLDERIDEKSYFRNTRAVEVLDPATGSYVKYKGGICQNAQPEQPQETEPSTKPEHKIKHL